jgi:hypothetical protein
MSCGLTVAGRGEIFGGCRIAARLIGAFSPSGITAWCAASRGGLSGVRRPAGWCLCARVGRSRRHGSAGIAPFAAIDTRRDERNPATGRVQEPGVPGIRHPDGAYDTASQGRSGLRGGLQAVRPRESAPTGASDSAASGTVPVTATLRRGQDTDGQRRAACSPRTTTSRCAIHKEAGGWR